MSRLPDDASVTETRLRFKKADPLVHIVAGMPRTGVWGTTACGILFQWEPGTERRADRTDDATTCIACLGYVGRFDW